MSQKKSLQQNKKGGKRKTITKDKPIVEAHKQAEKDIDNDPDLSTLPEPGDDLDEGELARLEGED